MGNLKRARIFSGLGYSWERDAYTGTLRFWCNVCEHRLRLDVNDDGVPMVIEHESTGDCDYYCGLPRLVVTLGR